MSGRPIKRTLRGHPIQDLAAEDGLTPLPSWTPDAKGIADDGLVAE